jgi:hypothetical protein
MYSVIYCLRKFVFICLKVLKSRKFIHYTKLVRPFALLLGKDKYI